MEVESREVVVRSTGESFSVGPAVAVQDVVRARNTLKEYAEDVAAALREVDAEIMERMDRSSAWTLSTEGVTFSAPSPAAHSDLNGQALYEALGTLVEDGALDEATRDSAAYLEVKLRLPAKGWAALQAWGPLADGRVKVVGQPAWAASKAVADRIAKSSDRAARLVESSRIAKATARHLTVKAAK